jgi:modification methylase
MPQETLNVDFGTTGNGKRNALAIIANSASLVDTETGEIVEGRFALEANALIIRGDLSYDDWESIGIGLTRFAINILWWIGDWVNYGDSHYGERHAQAIGITGLDYQTIIDAAWVAGKFQLTRRRVNLSWSHHREVAALEPEIADELLDSAEAEGWSRNELRAEARKAKRRIAMLPDTAHPGSLKLYEASASALPLDDETVDLIITSPPYNLGDQSWPMGGDGRTRRDDGIGYADDFSEDEYQAWQRQCLSEMYRVAKSGASLFYNHKPRVKDGRLILPTDWIMGNGWTLRQEIIWNRKSTHNHNPALFWPIDERIYWLTKGKPALPGRPIGIPTVWEEFGPEPYRSEHPAPFPDALPEMVIQAVGRAGITVLDPFMGSGTTLRVALRYGYDAIGVDVNPEYLELARKENGWMQESKV